MLPTSLPPANSYGEGSSYPLTIQFKKVDKTTDNLLICAVHCASRVQENRTRMGRDNELPLAIVFRAFSRPWLTIKIANQCHGKVMTPRNKLKRCASDVLDHFTLPRQFKDSAGRVRTYIFLLSLEFW